MKATIKYVAERFAHYNELCFEGKLPQPAIRVSQAKGFLGQLKYKTRRKLWGGIEHYDFSLHISARYDLEPDVIDDTVIHEMIHYYILYNRISDTSPHGKVFRQLMNVINSRFGRNITVRHKTTGEELASDTRQKSHYICVSTLRDGTQGITVCARTRIFHIYDALSRCADVRGMEWYYSRDPYFNRFPNSTTAKIYHISADDLAEKIKTARRLVCDGQRLYVAD